MTYDGDFINSCKEPLGENIHKCLHKGIYPVVIIIVHFLKIADLNAKKRRNSSTKEN